MHVNILRRLSRMTKEMRPAHRVDVLSHALLYYASLKTEKLGRLIVIVTSIYNIHKTANFLVDRWRKALDVQQTALENYQSLVESNDTGDTCWLKMY